MTAPRLWVIPMVVLGLALLVHLLAALPRPDDPAAHRPRFYLVRGK